MGKHDIVLYWPLQYVFLQAIDRIDAVGLVIPSSSVRLDATQKYILQSILSVFGKDIMNNMFLLLTFADHKKPQALIEGVEKETGIKFSSTCKFNNCALYENNEADADPFTKSYWDIGATSMGEFFTTLVCDSNSSQTIFFERHF